MLHIPIFSRPITSRPWNRFRSDTWLCPDFQYIAISWLVLLGFSVLFIAAWDFYFLTNTERILRRVCCIYHAFFSIFGGVYFVREMFRSKRLVPKNYGHNNHQHGNEEQILEESMQTADNKLITLLRAKVRHLLQGISPAAEKDPEVGVVSFRVFAPVSVICIVYVFCRTYIYVEDFISLRSQPSGVYVGVNKFIPFLGS